MVLFLSNLNVQICFAVIVFLVCNCWGKIMVWDVTLTSASRMNESNETWKQTAKYSKLEDSLILNEKAYRCLKRKVREHLPLIQLIVSESCLCFISANTLLLLQHTINYSTFSARTWGGEREKWMTKAWSERLNGGWSVAEVICELFSFQPHKWNVQSCTRLSLSLSFPLILKYFVLHLLVHSSILPPSSTISDQAPDSQIVFAPKKPLNVTLTKENAKQLWKNTPLFLQNTVFLYVLAVLKLWSIWHEHDPQSYAWARTSGFEWFVCYTTPQSIQR